MLFHHYKDKLGSVRAFGLMELLVSISIMVLVTSVIITRQSSFNGAILLRNQAYELAFTLRQAQLLAVSGASSTQRTYGVYVNKTTSLQNQYILFQDSSKDGRYDPGEELGLIGRLDSRFEIRNIFATSSVTGSITPTGISVTFTRPNFDAHFCSITECGLIGPVNIDIARTKVTTNGTGDVRRVEVTATGQITVVTY